MKFNRTLIVGLAILMVLLSGCLVFAEDTNGTDDGLLDNETDVDDDPEDNGTEVDDIGVVNGTLPPEPDNSTVDISYAISSEPTQSDNGTEDATKNATTVSDNHATGNPLVVLLFAAAGIGAASLRRRK
ncbi:hypothetical protein [Methanobrevibacter sp. UBA188]|uniref:hypothetical protein n=1 Tax=Methanobrevibacter sp. UBA188 TaxID=1915473 RepID=UPI0025E7F860|nr:hypothetical protein [Methanobrevibacter sp. UBA188]